MGTPVDLGYKQLTQSEVVTPFAHARFLCRHLPLTHSTLDLAAHLLHFFLGHTLGRLPVVAVEATTFTFTPALAFTFVLGFLLEDVVYLLHRHTIEPMVEQTEHTAHAFAFLRQCVLGALVQYVQQRLRDSGHLDL